MTMISYNGEEFDFAQADAVMNPALRQSLLDRIAACCEQELFDPHGAAHLVIYGDEFLIRD